VCQTNADRIEQKNWTVGTAIDFDGLRLMLDPFHARAIERFSSSKSRPKMDIEQCEEERDPGLWRPKLNLQYQR